MREAVIVAAVRTAVGKAPRGKMRLTRPEEMGVAVLKEVIKRTPGLDPVEIEDVIIGCSFPEFSQGFNIGRVLVTKAGLPVSVPGCTLNRFCSSGLNAVTTAAMTIIAGMADCIVAGGIESMSAVPMTGKSMSIDPVMASQWPGAYEPMGLTAENVAEKYGLTRREQDEFAVLSQNKAEAALKEGRFKEQIVPLNVRLPSLDAKGRPGIVEEEFKVDEGVRSGVTYDSLKDLRPAFKLGGTVTAANSSQMSDGAAALMLMSRQKAEAVGLPVMGIFRSFAVAGVEPELMGLGPIKAIPKALKLAGLELSQIELIELNEAFASQALACIRDLKIKTEITNVGGGAIALGHPLGCTGAKLTTQLLYEMKARDLRYGLVAMCIGFGMGAAAVFERPG
ncbi:MAG: thiolase family protein [Deltaproteobacteria bacterium]|nr:thiolase family protein [Deltaproteobacteria bacterium]